MEVSAKLFDKLCRVCLAQSSNMRSLFTKVTGEERSLFDVLTFTANIHVNFEDTLPKQVCDACESIMCKADAFKRRCLDSETILISLYQNPNRIINLPNKDKNPSSLDDTNDSKQKLCDLGPYQPSNCHFNDPNDKKNVTLHDYSVPIEAGLSSNKVDIHKVPGTSKEEVKQEILVNYDESHDFCDHFADDSRFESIPIEFKQETIKKEIKSHTCKCGETFNSKEKHKAHVKSKKCNKKLVKNKDSVRITEKGIRIKCVLKCDDCGRLFGTPNAYKLHQRIHIKDKKVSEPFQCSLCSRKFKKKSTLLSHIKRHETSDNIRHSCEICKREFKYKAYLENHILSAHSRNDGFACDVCAKGFSSQEGLEIHKASHKNEKKHQCTMCSKAFFMLCTLKEHIRTHTGEKPFLCSQCGRGFSQKNNLAQHMRRHQGLKPFKCEICEKRFVSKGELDAHSRKHSGAHPFVCDDCGSGFTTSSALVKHRRIHTGERPYHCDLCPMRFAASGTLKNHRRTHTGERPFQCSYCEKAFVQRNDLISHIRCHTGERPYICTQCGQSFRKASGLKTHVKMHKEPIQPPMAHGMGAVVLGMHLNGQ